MVTGLRPETFENLQLNAGVFLENFDASKYSDASALEDGILAALEANTGLIGATIGDGSFVAEPSIRNIEANGMRYAIVGSVVNDMWTIKLTGAMKEVNAANFKRVLASCDMDTSKANVTVLTVRTDIKSTEKAFFFYFFNFQTKTSLFSCTLNAQI